MMRLRKVNTGSVKSWSWWRRGRGHLWRATWIIRTSATRGKGLPTSLNFLVDLSTLQTRVVRMGLIIDYLIPSELEW